MTAREVDVEVMGRRERKKKGTHEALLAAATRLFAEHGIYVTTIEEITDAADLGKGTFYKHFESRDAIIAAVLHQGFGQLNAHMRAEVGAHGDTGAIIRDVVAVHTRFFGERPEYLLLFHQARGWLKLAGQHRNPVREEFRAYVDVLADLLGHSDPGKALGAEGRRREARVLAGIISGTFSYEVIVGGGDLAAMELVRDLARIGSALEGGPAPAVPGRGAPKTAGGGPRRPSRKRA